MYSKCFRLKFYSTSQGVQKAYVKTIAIEALEKSCAHQGLGIIGLRALPQWLYGLTQWGSKPGQHVILFTQALQQLLKGGVPLLDAITTLITMDLSPELKVVACDIAQGLLQGDSFSQCLMKHRQFFDIVYTGLVENGEKRGDYVQALEEALAYLKTREKLRQDLSKAVTYPLILILLSLGLLSFLCAFVLPELVQFIQGFTTDLPFSTRVLIALSHSYEILLTCILGLLFGLFIVGTQGARLSEKIAYWRDKSLLKIPVYGRIFYLRHLSIFFTTLATLSQGGQKLSSAFQVATEQVDNGLMNQQLRHAHTSLVNGKSLDVALKKVQDMPESVLKLIQVGLKSSRLKENLDLIIQDLNAQLNGRVERFVKYLQPCLLLVVGGVFLWIVLSIFLPIYQTLGVME